MVYKTILIITTENTSSQYATLRSDLFNYDLKDVFYVNKRFKPPTMSEKLEMALDKLPVILVLCSPELKNYMDEPEGDSKCKLLNKEEKSVLEKGFKENKEKIILVQYTEGDVSKMKPNCLKDHSPFIVATPTQDSSNLKTEIWEISNCSM